MLFFQYLYIKLLGLLPEASGALQNTAEHRFRGQADTRSTAAQYDLSIFGVCGERGFRLVGFAVFSGAKNSVHSCADVRRSRWNMHLCWISEGPLATVFLVEI
jgi:hypothetical protein